VLQVVNRNLEFLIWVLHRLDFIMEPNLGHSAHCLFLHLWPIRSTSP